MVYIHTDFTNTTILSDLSVLKPTEKGTNKLSMEIVKSPNETFYFRTPKLKFKSSKNNHVTIYFKGRHQKRTSDLYSFLYSLESYLIPLVNHELKGISDSIETNGIFRSCIRTPKSLNTKSLEGCLSFKALIDTSAKFFSEDNTEVSFNESDYGTFILACDCIMITPTTARLCLRIVQGKLYSNEKNVGFGILQEESEYKPEYKQFSLKVNEPKAEAEGESGTQISEPKAERHSAKNEKEITIELDD